MKKLSFFLLFCLDVSMLCFAQPKPIEITNTSNNNEYTFRYQNPNYCDYTIRLEFTNLQNGNCSCVLPFIESLGTGAGTLFTLKPQQPNQGVSFGFSYKSLKGRQLTKAPKPFLYVLPFSNAEGHRAVLSQSIVEVISGKKISDFYGAAFQMRKGDTIYAARRGMVSEIKDEFMTHSDEVWFSSFTNFVEVFHQDGTFAKYNRFKKGTIRVAEGQIVEAGEALGVVADDTFEGSTVAQLMVYYLSKPKAFLENSHAYNYVVPIFYTDTFPSGSTLQSGSFYQSSWPENIVTQEMSKRELKKWKSR